MARILVSSLPFAGHVGPLGAVSAELVRRGHEVVAYTGAKYQERFTAHGATWLPWIAAPDYDDADLAATFPGIGDGKGSRGDRANLELVVLGTARGQARDIIAGGPYDLMVVDQVAIGGSVAAAALGVPWATVAVTPLSLTSRSLPPPSMPWMPATGPAGRLRDAAARGLVGLVGRAVIDPRLNKLRAEFGVGPVRPGRMLDSTYSNDLVLAQGVPGLEHHRDDLPSHVHFVGRLAAPAAAGALSRLPAWWADIEAARQVVHVTQGTLDVDPADLLRPALTALADRNALVVASTGGVDPAVLGPLPANARVAGFLPHDLLLPRLDAMVTNGGWGGVLGAIEAGVPLVVAGGSLDKPEVARRVDRSGAGIDLRTGTPSPDRIGAAVDAVLRQPGYRSRARELGSAITRAGGVNRAAELIEALLHR